MHLLLAFHRRFLLRSALGRGWRATLLEIARKNGLQIGETSISHVVAGDWRSPRIERLTAEVLGVRPAEIWPQRELKPSPKEGNLEGHDEGRR